MRFALIHESKEEKVLLKLGSRNWIERTTDDETAKEASGSGPECVNSTSKSIGWIRMLLPEESYSERE